MTVMVVHQSLVELALARLRLWSRKKIRRKSQRDQPSLSAEMITRTVLGSCRDQLWALKKQRRPREEQTDSVLEVKCRLVEQLAVLKLAAINKMVELVVHGGQLQAQLLRQVVQLVETVALQEVLVLDQLNNNQIPLLLAASHRANLLQRMMVTTGE